MLRQIETPFEVLQPPTPEERQQMRVALERLQRRRDQLLAARGGKLFPDAGREVAEMRAERDAEPL